MPGTIEIATLNLTSEISIILAIHKHKNIDKRFSIPPHGDIQSLLQHLELFEPWSSKSVVVDHHLKINKNMERSQNYS